MDLLDLKTDSAWYSRIIFGRDPYENSHLKRKEDSKWVPSSAVHLRARDRDLHQNIWVPAEPKEGWTILVLSR